MLPPPCGSDQWAAEGKRSPNSMNSSGGEKWPCSTEEAGLKDISGFWQRHRVSACHRLRSSLTQTYVAVQVPDCSPWPLASSAFGDPWPAAHGQLFCCDRAGVPDPVIRLKVTEKCQHSQQAVLHGRYWTSWSQPPGDLWWMLQGKGHAPPGLALSSPSA